MQDTIASALKDNRRLVTFRMEDAEEFVAYLKTRYVSEIEGWLRICDTDDWKYLFLQRELEMRWAARRLQALKELAEVW
jgi:hypothetical protein